MAPETSLDDTNPIPKPASVPPKQPRVARIWLNRDDSRRRESLAEPHDARADVCSAVEDERRMTGKRSNVVVPFDEDLLKNF